jgi:hypothetical protein
MGKYVVLLASLLAAEVSAANWCPSDTFLHAVRGVESAQGLLTWGDHGRSLGDFQLSQAAWLDVTAARKARGLPTYPYESGVWTGAVSRMYAADYLSILRRELKKRLNRAPSAAEIYAAYNMGLGSFAQCRYRLAKVNPLTARKCQQINSMLAAGRAFD